MALVTSVALPAVRHPVALAKSLATLGVLADRRVIAGLGPGSSAADYDAVGVPFDERWARFDEALPLVRALLRGDPPPPGHFYRTGDLRLDPLPQRPPEVWSGSWGSGVRLRRIATQADGWMASAYNTTPERFRESRARLDTHLLEASREPADFPDLVATMWLYLTEDKSAAHHVLHEVLAPLLGRDPEGLQLAIGGAEHCIDLLTRYTEAGAHYLLLWPFLDPIEQLELLADRVIPQLPD